jgi:hypothetical protein
MTDKLRKCIHCHEWIKPSLGEHAPGTEGDTAGTTDDPHAPGDYDNICAPCNYGLGLQGHPDRA